MEANIPFECELDENNNIIVHGQNKARHLSQWRGKKFFATFSDAKTMKTTRQVRMWWGLLIPQVVAIILETDGVAITKEMAHLHICTSVLNIELKQVTVQGKTYLDYDRFRLTKAGIGDVSKAIDTVVQHYSLLGFEIELPSDGVTSYSDI